MQSTARILLLSTVVTVAAMVIAPALHADDDHAPSSSRMMDRMMGRGTISGMMGRMRMMDHCGTMMGSDESSGRPNDQWRAPRSPDDKAKR